MVEPDGIELHDGTIAGVGDRVVTRRNDRGLTTRDGHHFVKNGDHWTIRRRHRNGDLTLTRTDNAEIRIPSAYAAAHLELGYATTAARAQGRTVDTAHAFIDPNYTRETLYVTLTRHGCAPPAHPHGRRHRHRRRPSPAPARDAASILTSISHRHSAERSATEVARKAECSMVHRPRGHTPPIQQPDGCTHRLNISSRPNTRNAAR